MFAFPSNSSSTFDFNFGNTPSYTKIYDNLVNINIQELRYICYIEQIQYDLSENSHTLTYKILNKFPNFEYKEWYTYMLNRMTFHKLISICKKYNIPYDKPKNKMNIINNILSLNGAVKLGDNHEIM